MALKKRNIDLETMTLSDLKALRLELDKQIVIAENRERERVRHELKKIAEKYGFNLSDLINMPISANRSQGISTKSTRPSSERKNRRRRRGKVPPKYRNPSDPSKTWTGRGKQPLWIRDQIESGKSIDDFLI